MRIDGTYGTEPCGPPGGKGDSGKSSSPAGVYKPMGDGDDLTVNSSLEPLVSKARAAEEVNLKAVEEAKGALSSGQLDTPEAIRRAAERILDLGI